MTIEKILAKVDELKPNQYSDNIKIGWISELEGKIYKEMVLTHEHEEEDITFSGYTENDMGRELIAEDPYCNVYEDYLYAKIDFKNGETDRYTNSMIMFNADMRAFQNWYNRTHMPLSTPLKLF